MTERLSDRWPPTPSLSMGRRQWDRVIAALHRTGTKADAATADRIITALDAQADRARQLHPHGHPMTAPDTRPIP